MADKNGPDLLKGKLAFDLDLKWGDASLAHKVLEQSLIQPVEAFFAEPGKQFRSLCVQIAAEMAGGHSHPPSPRQVEALCQLIELIHAGSLVIDDIQDGSLERRGSPALYRKLGVPLAINVGNWMYFWAFQRLSEVGLSEAKQAMILKRGLGCLEQAHLGQAIDLSDALLTLPQHEMAGLCLASIELKTGALMGLAFEMGALLMELPSSQVQKYYELGSLLGVCLQMHDDLGNLKAGTRSIAFSKRFEDLKLRRPSWVWAIVAREYSAPQFNCFKEVVEALPEEKDLVDWLSRHRFFEVATKHTEPFLSLLVEKFERLSVEIGDKLSEPRQEFLKILERLKVDYGI